MDHRRAVTVVIAILSKSADSTISTFWRKAYIDLPLINNCCLCAAKMVGQLLRAAGQNIGGFVPSDLHDVTVFPRCGPQLPHEENEERKRGIRGVESYDAHCLCQDNLCEIPTDKASEACELHLSCCSSQGGVWRSWWGRRTVVEARLGPRSDGKQDIERRTKRAMRH